jgi:hypothetical protein
MPAFTEDGEIDPAAEAAMFARYQADQKMSDAELGDFFGSSDEEDGDEGDDGNVDSTVAVNEDKGSGIKVGKNGQNWNGFDTIVAAAHAMEDGNILAADKKHKLYKPSNKEKREAKLAEFANDEERAAYLAEKKAERAELKTIGFNEGKSEAAPASDTYQYEQDEPIPEGDPYHGKCERR